MVTLEVPHALDHSRECDLQLQEQRHLPRLTAQLGQQSYSPVICEGPQPVLCATTIPRLTSQYHTGGTNVCISHGMQLTRPTPVSQPPRRCPKQRRVEYLWTNNIHLNLYTLGMEGHTIYLSSSDITSPPGMPKEGVLNLFTQIASDPCLWCRW